MASFTDGAGKQWAVRITVGMLETFKEVSGLDIDKATRSAESFAEIFNLPPVALVRGLYVVCHDEIKARGVTEEQWAHLFDGDACCNAAQALAEGVIDFFPGRNLAKKLKGRLPELLAAGEKKAMKSLDQALEKHLKA